MSLIAVNAADIAPFSVTRNAAAGAAQALRLCSPLRPGYHRVLPFGIAVSPDGSRVYVVNLAGENVSVIDAATNTVATTIALPSGITPTLVFLLYQKGRGSRIFQAQDRAIDDFT
jgi:YVTN family beta-propeller protein